MRAQSSRLFLFLSLSVSCGTQRDALRILLLYGRWYVWGMCVSVAYCRACKAVSPRTDRHYRRYLCHVVGSFTLRARTAFRIPVREFVRERSIAHDTHTQRRRGTQARLSLTRHVSRHRSCVRVVSSACLSHQYLVPLSRRHSASAHSIPHIRYTTAES